MFRFEVGSHILIRKAGRNYGQTIEVKILDKAPSRIKAEILTDGWFRIGGIYWLSDNEWIAMHRVQGQ